MLKRLDLRQDNILAFRIEGRLDHDAFLQASHDLNAKLELHENFSIYLEIHEPVDVDFRAVWDSVRYATAHFRQ